MTWGEWVNSEKYNPSRYGYVQSDGSITTGDTGVSIKTSNNAYVYATDIIVANHAYGNSSLG